MRDSHAMKKYVKVVLHCIAFALVFPLYLFHLLESLVLGVNLSFVGMSQLLSLIPGIYGSWIRKAFYGLTLEHCSADCHIEFGTTFVTRKSRINNNVYIGSNCIISYADIGQDVLIGSGVHVLSGKGQHVFDDTSTPIRLQGGEKNLITIGEDSWIGNGAIIMANVGPKCVVAAGSVVTKDVEEFSIVAGNPAKLIRRRT